MKRKIDAKGAIVLTIGIEGRNLGVSIKSSATKSSRQRKIEIQTEELKRVDLNKMVKHLPFLEREEIEAAHIADPNLKLPKQSKVSSAKTEVLKECMKNLHMLISNSDISKFKEDELELIRKDKFKNVFYELAKDTPEWHKAIRRIAEKYPIKY